MDTEPPRLLLAVSALAGAAVWGAFHLVTALWAGQPVARTDKLRACVNVVAAAFVGSMTSFFLGPAFAEYLPGEALKNPHVVGFGVGLMAWEAVPFFINWARARAKRLSQEKR